MWEHLSKLNLVLSLGAMLIGAMTFFGRHYLKQHRKIQALEDEVAALKGADAERVGDIELFVTLANVEEVKAKISEIIRSEPGDARPVRIDNFGLDLETVQAMLRYSLTESLVKRTVVYRGLIIDPDSADIREVTGGRSNISQETASSAIEYIKKNVLGAHKNIQVFLKSYPDPPVMHGFIVNDEHCFIGFTHFESGGLVGGTTPYIYVTRKNESALSRSLFFGFETWFEHLFAHGPDMLKAPARKGVLEKA